MSLVPEQICSIRKFPPMPPRLRREWRRIELEDPGGTGSISVLFKLKNARVQAG